MMRKLRFVRKRREGGGGGEGRRGGGVDEKGGGRGEEGGGGRGGYIMRFWAEGWGVGRMVGWVCYEALFFGMGCCGVCVFVFLVSVLLTM